MIVGAGFARPIGIPTLREALNRFRQLEFGGAWPQEKEEADWVLNAWTNHGGDMEQFGKDVEEGLSLIHI